MDESEVWSTRRTPAVLMSHSVLVNNIPSTRPSRRAIYSQKPRPAPLHPSSNSTILQEKHLRKQNGLLAATAATISFPTPPPFSSPLCPFLCMHSHSFLSTLLSTFPRCCCRATVAAFGTSEENIKEAHTQKKKNEKEKQATGEKSKQTDVRGG